MHPSALEIGRRFMANYFPDAQGLKIVEIGAMDVNGSLKAIVPPGHDYIGVDMEAGPGVSIVLEDPYTLPFDPGSIDLVVTTSCFEHVEFFWELFVEILRVLAPAGLCYLNMPSTGPFHRYPVDCWRFFPDSGLALQHWGEREGYDCLLLESFVDAEPSAVYRDNVSVFLKDRATMDRYPTRIIDSFKGYLYGRRDGLDEMSRVKKDIEHVDPSEEFKAIVAEALRAQQREKRLKRDE